MHMNSQYFLEAIRKRNYPIFSPLALGNSYLATVEIYFTKFDTNQFTNPYGMAQKPPVLVNIMHAGFYPNVLPFRHEYYDSIAL